MAKDGLYKVDLAFARLELLELEHGKRTLTQCPGLKAMAGHIRDAEREAYDESRIENYERLVTNRCTCGRPECGGFECARNV